MKVEGVCHCGAIAYTAEIDPATVSICHCTDCQRLGGSAYRVGVPAIPGTFRLLRGEPTTYVKIAESGNPRIQAFCGTCSSQMYSCAAPDQPSFHMLRLGTIKQRAQLTPSSQIWHRSALAWVNGLAEIPVGERG